ncbi:MAG: TolC family protein, partial [Candidatus Eremiobacteraeota bacterium]|nr:TolC family protein [Candidatus Eremiobacteraeota bacterium]
MLAVVVALAALPAAASTPFLRPAPAIIAAAPNRMTVARATPKQIASAALVTMATAAPEANFRIGATPTPIATPYIMTSPAPHTAGLVLPPVPVLPSVPPQKPSLPNGNIAGTAGPFVGISRGAAIGMALLRNTDLAVAQSGRRIARYQVIAAEGVYDLQFQFMPQYQFSKIPAISVFQSGPAGVPGQTITAGANAAVSALTSTGGSFNFSTSAARVDNNIATNSYEPYYQTALALLFSQPLARGLAIDANRRAIQLARVNADLSTDTALLDASNTIDSVAVAYDNLVSAWKNVGIQEDALRQAKAQSASNGRLVRRGAAAPVDVVESDEQVNEFQDNVYSAIQNVASLQNSLKMLVLSDPADPAWTANLVPTTPPDVQGVTPRVNAVVTAALAQRPEVAQLRENLRSANIDIAYQRDLTKPEVDLNLGVTENGFAGVPTNPAANPFIAVIGGEVLALNQLIARANASAPPGTPPIAPLNPGALNAPLFPGSVGNIGTSYKTAFEGTYPTYTISATVAFPLHNQTAKANYRAALE